MLPHRHPGATEAADPLVGLRAAWPPAVPVETRGYKPLALGGTQPVGAWDLGDGRVVVVVGWPTGSITALPCTRGRATLRVAGAGDGAALALLARLQAPASPLPEGFEAARYDDERVAPAEERELGTDQTNISVVIGEQAIVKWRTAPDADGRRATQLRRHLRATGFHHTPPLLASLGWTDAAGERWFLADVDAFLPDAADGWDHGIATLRSSVESGSEDTTYARSLGTLTAELHVALSAPSELMTEPTRSATPQEMGSIRSAGLELLERTLSIDAPDQAEVTARASRLRASIEAMPSGTTTLAPIHGDLHIGQLVPWRGGIDVIDFDGAPEPTAPLGDLDAPARDVAQMVCSLWSLAAVVDVRTGGAYASRLRHWATSAEAAFLLAYRRGRRSSGLATLDERLFEAFVAEQLCRELLYAEATLPRWRYAPLQALRWRYPQ